MEALLSLAVGVLFATAVFLLLQRSLIQLVIGLSLLSNAANLLIFSVGRAVRATPPIIPEGETVLPELSAHPLPEALILTAIVIGFALLAFMVVLTYRAYDDFDTIDFDKITSASEQGGDA